MMLIVVMICEYRADNREGGREGGMSLTRFGQRVSTNDGDIACAQSNNITATT